MGLLSQALQLQVEKRKPPILLCSKNLRPLPLVPAPADVASQAFATCRAAPAAVPVQKQQATLQAWLHCVWNLPAADTAGNLQAATSCCYFRCWTGC
jgi:hypothetical protein